MDNRTLLVLAFLWQQTDETHTATIADIAAYLTEHGIPKPDARTIRKDIAQLVDFGIDIVSARGVQNQYHVASRHFDMPELRLLIDAVQSSRFITTRKSKALIDKLSAFASPYQNDLMRSGFYVDSRFKADNESIYITVDRIETVIEAHKKITFQYFDYAPDKLWVFASGGKIKILSPDDAIAEFRELMEQSKGIKTQNFFKVYIQMYISDCQKMYVSLGSRHQGVGSWRIPDKGSLPKVFPRVCFSPLPVLF